MKTDSEVKVKYGVWGLILGAAATMVMGFGWGGWTTRGSSVAMIDEAVLKTRVAICVAQFGKPPNAQRLKELKATNSWERAAYIEKGGWDRMPGEEKASDTVARPCADGLGALLEKAT